MDAAIGDIDLWKNEEPAFSSVDEVDMEGYVEYDFRNKLLEVLDASAVDNEDPFFVLYSSHLPHYPSMIPEEKLMADPYDSDTTECYELAEKARR